MIKMVMPGAPLGAPLGGIQTRFSVLGPMRAWRDGREVDLGTPQQQAILAALLLRKGGLALGEDLIGALWSGNPPRSAAGAIRTYVSRLRHALSSGDPGTAVVIESVGGGYALQVPTEALDVDVFHERVARARLERQRGATAAAGAALAEALALWKGLPLAGVPGPYAETQRSYLVQAQLSARAEFLEDELALGRHRDAVSDLLALVIEHPLREQFRELLMIALYRSGRQAEALAVFRDTRQLLDDELGVDPGPALQDLHLRILKGDSTLLHPRSGSICTRPRVLRQRPSPGVRSAMGVIESADAG